MMTELIGVSRNIERIKELIVQVANSEVSTIVIGETGVGKELIVQNLYRMSARNGKPIVKINCSGGKGAHRSKSLPYVSTKRKAHC